MEFSLIPHYMHQISDYVKVKSTIYDTIEELIDPYMNLQFVELNDTICVLYTLASKKTISDHDANKLTLAFNRPVVFERDKCAIHGECKFNPFMKTIDKPLPYIYNPKHVRFL
jgi:hypothetical protein